MTWPTASSQLAVHSLKETLFTTGTLTASKVKHGRPHGQWIRGRIRSQTGANCILDTGTGLLRVNQSKLRKAHDDWSDIDAPLDDEAVGNSHQLPEPLWLAEAENEVDIQELYSGSTHLSSACENTCLRVGPPIDLRQGFDITSQVGQQRAWSQITRQRPRAL